MLKNLFDFMCTGRVKKRHTERPKNQSVTDEFVVESIDDKPIEEAIKENRHTPIDFDTFEVKFDHDVEHSSSPSNSDIASFTPSPIPEVAAPYRRRSSMSFRHKPEEHTTGRRVASVNRVVDMKQTSHRRGFHSPFGASKYKFTAEENRITSTPKVLAVRPTRNSSDASESGKIAFLERRIRELELSHIESSPKYAKDCRREAIEIGDELLRKDLKVKKLENKLLKAYQKMERLSDENLEMMHNVTIERNEAKQELEKCLERMNQLENELDYTRDSVNNETTRHLNEKIWKQDRELRETRRLQNKLKEKEEECEEMRKIIDEVETKNEQLMKQVERIQTKQKAVSTSVLSQENYGQSCSSSSTPVSDDNEIVKQHRGSTQLLRNLHKDGEITPFMSRTIREQNRSIATCRAMVACIKEACVKMEKDGELDTRVLFGDEILAEFTDDSFEEEAEDSTPYTMFSAENVLSKQAKNLEHLDAELNSMRKKIGSLKVDGLQKISKGDLETCRLQ